MGVSQELAHPSCHPGRVECPRGLVVVQDGVQTCGPCFSCFRQHSPPGGQADRPPSVETRLGPVIWKWGFHWS